MAHVREREGSFEKEFGTAWEVKKRIARYPVYGTRVDVWKGRALMTRGGKLMRDNLGLKRGATGIKEQMASNNPATVEVTDKFKSDVRLWLRLTEQKAQVSKDIKVLNERLRELKESVCDFMAANQLDACNIAGGKVQLYRTKAKEALTKDSIKTAISSFLASREGKPNDPVAGEMAEFILANRAVKVNHALRRSGGAKKGQGGDNSATSALREQPPPQEEEESSQDENDV
ncbi:hypothetical protein KFL_006340130 [Klebsormidium nitens]|uniref:Uncharacterized protein n=1 Tax=Klebsormidium nitens TaxID=105231 RepID=A0A1Y1IHW3_KLENI|nr:hypothetical protein KFL_006340130 [Klebsormidium nitens]|eukprot:GAQ90394.1 hypothetical protein KFL_006340130 [Klebsormidium nitens]